MSIPPRRRFLKSLAAAPLLPAAWAAPQAAPSAAPSPSPTPTPSETRPGAVAEALGEAVRHRYGDHLQPADVDQIKKSIEENLLAAERLRKRMKLGNADEPVVVFQARPPSPAR